MSPAIRFFSSDGRTSRPRLLLIWALALVIGWLCVRALTEYSGAAHRIVWPVLGAVFAKLIAESIRRLHDSGRSGRSSLPVGLGVIVLTAMALLIYPATGVGEEIGAMSGLIAIGLGITLLKPGTAGANAYGEPCRHPLVVSPGPGEHWIRGMAGALALSLLGGAFGYELARRYDIIVRMHEDNARPVEVGRQS